MSTARIEAMLLESGLDTAELPGMVAVLAPLSDLVDHTPAPSAELAELFGPTRAQHSGFAISLAARRRGAATGALVIALSAVGATGLSAAANTLPRPLQHQVSQFSHHYLPFDLPEPPPPGHPLGASVPHRPGTAPDSGQVAPPRTSGVDGSTTRHGHGSVQPGTATTPSAAPAPASRSAEPSAQPSARPSSRPAAMPSAMPSPRSTPSSTPHDGGQDQGAQASDGSHQHQVKQQHQGVKADGDQGKGGDNGNGHGSGKGNHQGHHQGGGPGNDQGSGPGNGEGNGSGNGQGNGQGNGPGNGQGQGDGQGNGQGGDGGGEQPPALPQVDPPQPDPPALDLLPGVDQAVDGVTGGN